MAVGASQNHKANKVVIPQANYETSGFAQNNLDMAQQMFNSRMPGASNAENNIFTNNSNALGSIERNSTSGAQNLSMISGAQGNTNNALNQLGQQENMYKLNMLSNLNAANQGMVAEGDKVFGNQVRKQELAMNEKNGLRGAAMKNIGTGLNEMSATAYLGAQGGFNKK